MGRDCGNNLIVSNALCDYVENNGEGQSNYNYLYKLPSNNLGNMMKKLKITSLYLISNRGNHGNEEIKL